MPKKKLNPNRMPISKREIDVKQIVRDSSDKMMLRAWALILGAFADFYTSTTDAMLQIWERANSSAIKTNTYALAAAKLKKLEQMTGLQFPFGQLSSDGIRTKGELDRFIRRVERNALHSAFAVIVDPIIEDEILQQDELAVLLKKACELDKEIEDGMITLEDLLGVLEDEYSIILELSQGEVKIFKRPLQLTGCQTDT